MIRLNDLMSTIQNSKIRENTLDGMDTAWGFNMKDGPIQGKLDLSKRRALKSEVQNMVKSQNLKKITGQKNKRVVTSNLN